MSALLNKRQQIAQAITRELDKFDGVWVVNSLPLDDGQRLRIQILPPAHQVLHALQEWGHNPVFVNMLPRVTHFGMKMAEVYEIDLPHERQPIADRVKERTLAEVELERERVKKYLGAKP